MSAPVLAEGRVSFEDKAGGAYVIVRFGNEASFVISRGDLFAAGRAMRNHALEQFEQQQADIVPLAPGNPA